MRVTIKGLRQWVVGAAGLLLAVVAGFFFYGRYRLRQIEKDLPARLGINIQQTATGWTYSQSSGGHTLFTMKASKESQLKSGHVLLHDVDITVYGPPGSGRQDRIYGDDFDYDTNTQIAVSLGEVNIELAGFSQPAAGAASAAPSNTIRARTSGLTFTQKTGVADTGQPVDFQLPRAAGSSVGANYDSKSGVLVLDRQVKITTSSNGKAAVVQAAHATIERATMQAFLTDASLEYETEDGSADQATVHFRKDGTAERIDAQGHVVMKTDTGATVRSETARIAMDAKSQPTQADLGGGVAFASMRGNDSMQGTSSESTLHFATATGADGKTTTALRHAEFRKDVNFADEIAGLEKDPRGRAEKRVQGQTVDVDFAPVQPGEPMEARKAVAVGNPVVTMRQMPSKGPATATRISGDRLVATLGAGNLLQTLDGTGHTKVVEDSTDGAHDASQGDVLHATFDQEPVAAHAGGAAATGGVQRTVKAAGAQPGKTAGKRGAAAGPRTQTTLATAVQDGNVVLAETPASHSVASAAGAPGPAANKPGAVTQPATLTGWAQHAEYHAADQVLHLSGSPRISDGTTMQVSAVTIDYHRDTQDAAADGDVKATYTESPKTPGSGTGSATPAMGGNGPVHVIAERAALHHATNVSDFYGAAHRPARMWQDPDSLTAPVIEIDRNKNLLKAWGENTGSAPVVHTNFVSAFGAQHQQSVARVTSETLVYSDKDRQADFRGEVSLDQGNEAIHAGDALVFLKPAPASGGASGAVRNANAQSQAAEGGNSQIDHVIATGHVEFTQPGRKGDGEKLVYTADNGKYVLTGLPEALPRLWDRVHGTTTGTALLFNSQDDSVEVSGGKSSAVTDTRAPK